MPAGHPSGRVRVRGAQVCAITWREGCADAAPPEGFTAESTVADLCRRSCIFYLFVSHKL